MTPAEFSRRRGRIEHDHTKPQQWKQRALRRLVIEARAVVVVCSGRMQGWQMANGKMVCVKQRYKNEETAQQYLSMIRACGTHDAKPNRAYHCPYCAGWHLTSH